MKKLILLATVIAPLFSIASDGPGNSNVSAAQLKCVVIDANDNLVMNPPSVPVKVKGITSVTMQMNGLTLYGAYSSSRKTLNADVWVSHVFGGSGGSGVGEFPIESKTQFVANYVPYTFKCNID